MLSLKILVKPYAPYVIFLQETMCVGFNIVETLSPWLKNWSFYSLDLEGHFGGLVISWSPNIKVISTSFMNFCILVELEVWDLASSFCIINFYGPYTGEKLFWDEKSSSRILYGDNFILGVILNLPCPSYHFLDCALTQTHWKASSCTSWKFFT